MNFEDCSGRADRRPAYGNQYAKWLEPFPWKYMVSLSDHTNSAFGVHGAGASQDQGSAFAKLIDTFWFRMGERTFGRLSKRKIEHATFLEAHTKSGFATAWHAHALVHVPEEYCEKFLKEGARQWRRITCRSLVREGTETIKSGSFDAKLIYDAAGAVSYTCKFAQDDRCSISINLPRA